MKKISILLISILLIILNLTTIYADEISIEEVYNDKSKVIINDNESIPDGANILLISENGNYILSVTKEERNKLKEYKIIGYSVDGKNCIYNSGNKLISNINYYTFKGKNVKIPYFSLLVIAF